MSALEPTSAARDRDCGALRAIDLGEDVDDTGAAYSTRAGASQGRSEIASRWLEKLARRAEIEHLADRLTAFARSRRHSG